MIPKSFILGSAVNAVFDIIDDATTGNTADPLVPEAWVREALFQTSQKRVASQLVWTDFSDEVARFGQIIHTHRPADMVATRKRDGQDVKTSSATVENVDVKLNQWIHQSFIIYDAEQSLTFKQLIEMHLVPAAKSVAQMVDEVICTQVYQFIGASEAGSLDAAVTKSTIINTRRKLEKNNVDPDGMYFLVGPDSKAQILSIEGLTKVNEAGDGGMALRKAEIGELFGFIFFMTQNVPCVAEMSAASPDPVLIDNASGYPKGHTGNIDLDGIVTALEVGQWIKIAGEGAPRRIATVTALAAGAQTITLEQALISKVQDNAAVDVYPCQDTAAQFDASYIDDIQTAAFTDELQRGQLMSFGNLQGVYGLVTSPETVEVNGAKAAYNAAIHATLDNPLEVTVAAATKACVGPDGNYNFAFHRNAVALVSRPPAPPRNGMGVMSFAAAFEGLAMRATMTYDGVKQGTRVTLDTFIGVKTMDDRLGSAVYANAD